MRITAFFLFTVIIAGCAREQKTPVLPFQADRDAFVASVLAIGKARLLSQPPSGSSESYTVSSRLEHSVDSLTAFGLTASKSVSDAFLNSVHPELALVYRQKLIAGTRLWQEGLRKSMTEGGVAGLDEQAMAAHLDSQWVAWLDRHVEVSRMVIP